MKIKTKLLQAYLDEHKMTVSDFAKELEVGISEINKMLKSEAVCEKTACKFIYFIGAYEAQRLIDWQAMNKQNPLEDEM